MYCTCSFLLKSDRLAFTDRKGERLIAQNNNPNADCKVFQDEVWRFRKDGESLRVERLDVRADATVLKMKADVEFEIYALLVCEVGEQCGRAHVIVVGTCWCE